VSPLLDEYDLLLADSSVLFVFFQAGRVCTEKLLAYCGARLFIVDSVSEEINDHRSDDDKRDGIAAFEASGRNEPLESPLKVVNQVQRARDFNRKYGMGGADIGEMETVFYADWAWDEGHQYLILVGDAGGQHLADDNNLGFLDSHRFLMELICCGALNVEEGELVASKIFGDNFDPNLFRRDVQNRCPQAIEAAEDE